MPTLSDFQRSGFRPLPMVFFGRGCIAWLSGRDMTDARFFFRHHLGAAPDAAGLNVVLHANGGFFRSLLAKDRRRKHILAFGSDEEAPFFSRCFREWSDAPSPLPPFFRKDLVEELHVKPGTVVLPPGSETGWCITGANYVGKTSLALHLMRRGFALVSDHLVVRERATGWCHGYHSPLGLRRENFLRFRRSGAMRRIDHRVTLSEVTGPVALVHAEDIGGRRAGGCGIGLWVEIKLTEAMAGVEAEFDRAAVRLYIHPGATPGDIAAILIKREHIDA